ncbi:MAG: hypothetical protein LBQ27_05770 [Clostridiales bacterium]|jgi:23S rRNA (uracil1939-C5)-methyltransferase|nr:hypothetical protein [Clostridiales bacterium]
MERQKNKMPTLKIASYDREGKGLAFLNGKRYIIDGALFGETVVLDSSDKRKFRIIEPSPFRKSVDCVSFARCGGCNLLFAEYEEQLRLKKYIVAECLKDTVNEETVSDTVGMYYPYKYRNKIHLAFARQKGGKVNIGFFEENSSVVTDFKGCLLHGKFAEILTDILRGFVEKTKQKIYDEKNGREGLRYAAARYTDNNLMLTIVSTYPSLPGAEELYASLKEHFNNVSLYLNVNRLDNSMIFSEKFIHLCGEKTVEGKLCGVKFEYFPAAFIQVNDIVATKIYNDILNRADITSDTIVYDIYSGIGITSVLFAKRGARVYSVELSNDAVKSARTLKKVNDLGDKIINIRGDAGAELAKLSLQNDDDLLEIKAVNTIKSKNAEAEKHKAASENARRVEYVPSSPNADSIVFVDPPRSGLDERVTKGILRLKPKQIIYLSCNPVTLGENLKAFSSEYTVTSVTPYDMFPQTKHVETLVFMDVKTGE